MLKDMHGQQISLENLPYDIASIVVEDGKWEVNKLRKALNFLGIRGVGGARKDGNQLVSSRSPSIYSSKRLQHQADLAKSLAYIQDSKQTRENKLKCIRAFFVKFSELHKTYKTSLKARLVFEYIRLLMIQEDESSTALDMTLEDAKNIFEVAPVFFEKNTVLNVMSDADPEFAITLAQDIGLRPKAWFPYFEFISLWFEVLMKDYSRIEEIAKILYKDANYITTTQIYINNIFNMCCDDSSETERINKCFGDGIENLIGLTYLHIIISNDIKKAKDLIHQIQAHSARYLKTSTAVRHFTNNTDMKSIFKSYMCGEDEYKVRDLVLQLAREMHKSVEYIPLIAEYYDINPAQYKFEIENEGSLFRAKKKEEEEVQIISDESIAFENLPFPTLIMRLPLLLYPLYIKFIKFDLLSKSEKSHHNSFFKMLGLSHKISNYEKSKILDEVRVHNEVLVKSTKSGNECEGYPFDYFNAMSFACALGDKALVKQLLHHGADINHITYMKKGEKRYYATPYNFVSEHAGIDFLKYLIDEKGMLINKFIPIEEGVLMYPFRQAAPGFEFKEHSERVETISKFERLKWILEFDYILEKSSKSMTTDVNESKYKEENKFNLKETGKEISPEAYQDEKAAARAEELYKAILLVQEKQREEAEYHKMYLDVKQFEFETALLNMIANNNHDADKVKVIQLLKDNPELQLHALSNFFRDVIQKDEVKESALCDEILSSFPQMFHKYCTIKKKYNEQRLRAFQDDGAGEEELPHDNLYRIKSNTLISKAFIYLHPDLMQEMEKSDYKEFKKTIIAQLETGISFIETKSTGISGIKMSKKKQGAAKIKLANKDPRIFISDIYRDASGNLLFVAKYIVFHKDQEKDMTRYQYGQIVDKEASIAAIIGEIEIGSARS